MKILISNIGRHLIKESPNHWRILLPFIVPEYAASDIEQILETKKGNPEFKLELTLISEQPKDVDHYEEHEYAVRELFERIFERRYKITLITVSGIDHDALLNNKMEGYEYFKVDHFVSWTNFLKTTLTISSSQFYSHNLTFKGRRLPKNVSLVMEEDCFNEIYCDISGTNFEFEHLTKGTHEKEIAACSLKLPIGSIIHMTVRP